MSVNKLTFLDNFDNHHSQHKRSKRNIASHTCLTDHGAQSVSRRKDFQHIIDEEVSKNNL
eukprot:5009076-Amphidinium_carterae.1